LISLPPPCLPAYVEVAAAYATQQVRTIDHTPYVGNSRSEEQNTRILFRFGLFCEYTNLEYVCIPVMYRVKQAEYAIRIPAGAPLEYVNAYSAGRPHTPISS